MDLQKIKYFLAVVDFGTFLAASEHVHVSQPTLSAGIHKLEQSLNVTLFIRGSRAAKLTPAGELFLAQARPAYNQLMSIKARLSAGQESINLGVLNTIPMDHIAEIIGVYKRTNPYVYIELVVGTNEELSQMLQSQKLDLIFTTVRNTRENFTLLFEEHLDIAVSAQHPFATYKKLDLKQLSEQPFIERTNCESWHDIHQQFQEKNIQPHSVCRAESDESVLSLVAANLGVSVMPARETPYDVKFIHIKDLKITRSIGIAVLSQQLPPHIQTLYETIVGLYRIVGRS